MKGEEGPAVYSLLDERSEAFFFLYFELKTELPCVFFELFLKRYRQHYFCFSEIENDKQHRGVQAEILVK